MSFLLLGLAMSGVGAPTAPSPVNCSWMSQDFREFRRSGQDGYLSIDKPVMRPGTVLALSPKWSNGPFGEKDVPTECLVNWRVSDPKVLKLSRDRTTLSIGDNAVVGETYKVTARMHGRRFEANFRITGRDEQVLVGRWSERDSSGCGSGARPVVELVFSQFGHYSYTFPDMMVETMTSGSGTYVWDAAHNALTLDGTTVKATLTEETLTIEGRNFDAVAPEVTIEPGTDRAILSAPQVCKITFTPIGAR